MTHYKVTVNGNTYEVGVEEVGSTPEVKTVQAVTPSLSAASAGQVAAPAPVIEPAPVVTADAEDVLAPLPGTVISVNVSVGEKVKAGQVLLVFEAMKMENELVAPRSGSIAKIYVTKGETLESGKAVITIA